MRSSRRRFTAGRKARLCAPVAATVALGAIAAAPAQATLGAGAAGPETGENITVFHNIDFVAAFGVGTVGQTVTIEVLRGGVLMGTTTGPLIDAEGLAALEANHGPEGAPQAGDCWTGHAPDIRPRDVVRVTNGTEVDEVIVDEIEFVGEPQLLPNGDVIQNGVARRADGTPIPAGELDSNGFLDTSKFRGPAHEVIAWADRPGGFTNVFHPPYDMERNQIYPTVEERRNSLLNNGGHEAGFGHVDPLPLESMLLDGNADDPTIAPGCDTPVAEANRVTSAPDVNAATGDLAIAGTRATGAGAGNVEVTLTDGAGNVAGPFPATESARDWTLNVTAAQRAGLVDGPITVAGAYDHGGTALTGKTLTIQQDTVLPVASAGLAPGTYEGARSLSLSASEPGLLEYSRNGGTTWSQYTGPIALPVGSHTIAVRATDDAGNVSAPMSLAYTINAVPVIQQVAVPSPPAQSTPPGLAPPALEQASAPSLRLAVASYRLASRTSLKAARTKGIAVRFRAPAGADTVTFSVYRAGSRTVVAKRSVKVSDTRRRTVRIRSSRFRSGRYSLEITPSQGGNKGATSKRSFRIG